MTSAERRDILDRLGLLLWMLGPLVALVLGFVIPAALGIPSFAEREAADKKEPPAVVITPAEPSAGGDG